MHRPGIWGYFNPDLRRPHSSKGHTLTPLGISTSSYYIVTHLNFMSDTLGLRESVIPTKNTQSCEPRRKEHFNTLGRQYVIKGE